MLFRCPPQAPAGGSAASGPPRTIVRDRKHLTVDIHCHLHVPEADELVADIVDPAKLDLVRFSSELTRKLNAEQNEILMPKLTQLDERLSVMDETGVDIQAVSPSPFHYHYWAEADLARALVQTVNDRVAEFQAQKPDRLVAMCTVPLQHPELAVTELERCYREHGMRGVEISTNVEGAELSRAGLDKFFSKVEELDMLIFLHPLGTSEGSRMRDHYFTNLMGHPLESALAVGHLVFDGYLEQYPGLKICVAHGGGFIPSYWGRFDHPYPTRADVRGSLPHPPSHYVKKLYFDTVVFSEMQLRHLIEAWGADHILMGTDYPYDMAEPDPVGQVDSVEGLSTADKAQVWGGNAQRLLGITVKS